MLTWDKTMMYVKANLSLPSKFIEDTDAQIKDYLKLTALSEFSTYFPDWERTPVYPNTPETYKVSGKTNQFYFYDDEECDIINVKHCYFNVENELWTGHPLVGPYSLEHYKWFALGVFKSKLFQRYSEFDRVYRYIAPNIIEILPENMGTASFVVEYERTQPADLTKIPQTLELMFMDLCLAHEMIKLGNIRSNYGNGNLTTPFGDIPLNGEDLRQRGDDLRQKIVEKLESESVPDIIIEIY